MDVKSTVLNGIIKEKVYVDQSKGFEYPQLRDYVIRLKKALYGLKHALWPWYEHLTTFLLKNRFQT